MLLKQVHKDWTLQVKYCSTLEGFLSCSSDTHTALVFHDMHRRMDSVSFKIAKGVASFDYSEMWNVIGVCVMWSLMTEVI